MVLFYLTYRVIRVLSVDPLTPWSQTRGSKVRFQAQSSDSRSSGRQTAVNSNSFPDWARHLYYRGRRFDIKYLFLPQFLYETHNSVCVCVCVCVLAYLYVTLINNRKQTKLGPFFIITWERVLVLLILNILEVTPTDFAQILKGVKLLRVKIFRWHETIKRCPDIFQTYFVLSLACYVPMFWYFAYGR